MKNVVLIMQDHQLYFDHPAIKRPCFDAFRQKGTHFVNARSVTPLCSHGGHMDKDAYMSSEVLNIPLALYSPDREGGVKDDRPASNVDIPVTMLDALGLKFDDESVRIGESLLKPTKRDYFVSVTHGHFTPHVALSVEKDGYRYVKNYDDVSELYDMTADPYSLVNLALNPEYAEKTEYFEKLLAKWIEDNDFKPYKQDKSSETLRIKKLQS